MRPSNRCASFVYAPGEGLDDDGAAAQVAGLERGVLAGGALAVVLVADDDPADAGGLVSAGGGWHWSPFTGLLVLDLVQFVVLGVCGAGGR